MSATQHAQKIREDSVMYLTTALLQLLQKAPLSDIKVTQLVQRAGVSRMAFYRNFDTLEDILAAYFAPKIVRLFDDVIDQVPSAEKLADMQQFFDDLGDDLALADQRHYEHIIRQLFNANMERYYSSNEAWADMDADNKRYWIKFMSAGVYGIWKEWLLHRQDETLDDLHQLIGKLQYATAAVMSED